MFEETIKVFAMRVDENKLKVYKGRIEEISNTLEAKQKFVGGLITVVGLTDELDIIANDEGKLEHLLPNRAWLDEDGNVLDILVGNIMVCRFDDDGNFTSVLESDIPIILKRLPAIMAILGHTICLRTEDDLPEYDCEDGGNYV